MLQFARRDLRRWLEAADVPPQVVDEVTLACSEACANAVEHPTRPTRQLVEVDGRRRDGDLELRVRDYGTWTEHGSSELRGRGLNMIGRLMDSVDVERRPDGTAIVMHRSLAAASDGTHLHDP